MILLQLFTAFLRIGAFSFGGGYAMIPLIASEVERFGWIDDKTFTDIIAIAEMTPGPIAVNLATFVGFKTQGLVGAAIATLGVVTPSFLLILLIGAWLKGLKGNPIKDAVFAGFRPVVVGLVLSAVLVVARSAFVLHQHATQAFQDGAYPGLHLAGRAIDLPSILIGGATLIALFKTRVHPGLILLGTGGLGILVGIFFPAFGR